MAEQNGALWKEIGLGWLAGMRSMAPLAMLSRHLSEEGAGDRLPGPLSYLGDPTVATLLTVASLGETVADKLPITPSRTEPLSLAGRFGSGALIGATLAALDKGSMLKGALLGGVAALVGSYAGYFARSAATEQLDAPNVLAGVLEDAIVWASGLALLKGGKG